MDRSVGRVTTLTLTSIAHFLNDGTAFFVPVIAAIVAADHSVDPILITILFLTFYATASAMSLVAGRLADRAGQRGPLMEIGLGIISHGSIALFAVLAALAVASALATVFVPKAARAGKMASFGGYPYRARSPARSTPATARPSSSSTMSARSPTSIRPRS